jgi:hypothetical protein
MSNTVVPSGADQSHERYVAGNPFGAIFGHPIVISEYQETIAAGNAPILLVISRKTMHCVRLAGSLSSTWISCSP